MGKIKLVHLFLLTQMGGKTVVGLELEYDGLKIFRRISSYPRHWDPFNICCQAVDVMLDLLRGARISPLPERRWMSIGIYPCHSKTEMRGNVSSATAEHVPEFRNYATRVADGFACRELRCPLDPDYRLVQLRVMLEAILRAVEKLVFEVEPRLYEAQRLADDITYAERQVSEWIRRAKEAAAARKAEEQKAKAPPQSVSA